MMFGSSLLCCVLLIPSFFLLCRNRLYQGGHLVHGDLSEYNILVAPSYFVGTHAAGTGAPIRRNALDLQPVFIDFGQAVDTRHPEAMLLLERDLERVLSFFAQQGVDTPTIMEALALIME
jgi:serine/threonine-protein kinase RIO1